MARPVPNCCGSGGQCLGSVPSPGDPGASVLPVYLRWKPLSRISSKHGSPEHPSSTPWQPREPATNQRNRTAIYREARVISGFATVYDADHETKRLFCAAKSQRICSAILWRPIASTTQRILELEALQLTQRSHELEQLLPDPENTDGLSPADRQRVIEILHDAPGASNALRAARSSNSAQAPALRSLRRLQNQVQSPRGTG